MPDLQGKTESKQPEMMHFTKQKKISPNKRMLHNFTKQERLEFQLEKGHGDYKHTTRQQAITS